MIQAIRGTYDVLPAEVGIWHAVESRLRQAFHLYGFGEIRQPVIAELPTITDHLCDGCRTHFDQFKSYLAARNIPFRVNQRLVRGLDYYTGTTFEITSG